MWKGGEGLCYIQAIRELDTIEWGCRRFEILQRAGAMVLTFRLIHGGTGVWRVSGFWF